MTCSCSKEAEVYRNRDQTLRFIIQGPGDLTDAKVWFSVKQDETDPDADAKIVKKTLNLGGGDDEILITDGYVKETDPESKFYNQYVTKISVFIEPADTVDLEPGDYSFDVVVMNTSDKKYQAVDPSRFRVLQPTTMT